MSKMRRKLSANDIVLTQTKVQQMGRPWKYDVKMNVIFKETNSVTLDKFSMEEAILMLNTLKDCKQCADSYNLTNCKKCTLCFDMSDSNYCYDCRESKNIKRCTNCSKSEKLVNCENVDGKKGLRDISEELNESFDTTGFVMIDGDTVVGFEDDDMVEVDIKKFKPTPVFVYPSKKDILTELKRYGLKDNLFVIKKVVKGKIVK